jgi:Ala-tRNA(Pro) deacylase
LSSIQIDPNIYTTAPSGEDRLSVEMDTYALLDSLGIGYLRLDHGAAATVDDCLEVERILGIEICKNLFLCNAAKTAYYLLMIPGDKKYRAPLLSEQLHSTRLSFADADSMQKYLRIMPGSVSVLGLMNDTGHAVRLLIDRDVLRHEFVGCHPCVNTSSLRIRLEDILNRFLPHTGHVPTVVEL